MPVRRAEERRTGAGRGSRGHSGCEIAPVARADRPERLGPARDASPRHRSIRTMRAFVLVSAAAAAAAVSLALRPAQGATGTSGELGQGGSAKGDISKTAGDVDTIGVNLVAGMELDVRWSGGFPADVHFFDPDE